MCYLSTICDTLVDIVTGRGLIVVQVLGGQTSKVTVCTVNSAIATWLNSANSGTDPGGRHM